MDVKHMAEAKQKAILHLTEALGEEARSEPGSPEESDARDHRADAEEEIAKARDRE
jgi:hypothetical protein